MRADTSFGPQGYEAVDSQSELRDISFLLPPGDPLQIDAESSNSPRSALLESDRDSTSRDAEDEVDLQSDAQTWRPTWLRPAIVGDFAALFICLIAVLAFMVVYSRLNDGLCDARQNLAYIWRFGPTACKFR